MTIKEKKELLRGKKLYWHVHHEILLEECYSAKERRDYIRTKKVPSQVPIRLKAMKPVKQPLKIPDCILEKLGFSSVWTMVCFSQTKGKLFDIVMRQHRREYPDCPCNSRGQLVNKNGSRFTE